MAIRLGFTQLENFMDWMWRGAAKSYGWTNCTVGNFFITEGGGQQRGSFRFSLFFVTAEVASIYIYALCMKWLAKTSLKATKSDPWRGNFCISIR